MKLQKKLQQWDAWLLAEVKPHSLALARIFIGFGALCFVLNYGVNAVLYFSNQGTALPLYAHAVPESLQFLFAAPEPSVIYILYPILCLATAGIIIGYQMRLCVSIVLLLSLYFWQIALHIESAVNHRVLFFALFVLLFSGADKTFSLHMKLKKGSWTAYESVCALPLRLLAFQVTATYLGAGWQKMWLPHWQSGEILYYSFISSMGTSLSYWFARLDLPMGFYDLMVQAVNYWEYAMPFGIWWKPTQKYFFVMGILFHVSVLLFLSIWSFLVILVPLYITFLDPEKVYEWCRRRLSSIL